MLAKRLLLLTAVLLLFAASVALWQYNRRLATLRFVLPNGFTGAFLVVEDGSAPPLPAKGPITLVIPPTRIVRVRSFQPLTSRWFRVEARTVNGTVIKVDQQAGDVLPSESALCGGDHSYSSEDGVHALEYWVGDPRSQPRASLDALRAAVSPTTPAAGDPAGI